VLLVWKGADDDERSIGQACAEVSRVNGSCFACWVITGSNVMILFLFVSTVAFMLLLEVGTASCQCEAFSAGSVPSPGGEAMGACRGPRCAGSYVSTK